MSVITEKLRDFNPGNSYVLMLPRWYPDPVDPSDGNFIQKHLDAISSKLPVCTLFIRSFNSRSDYHQEIEIVLRNKNHLEIKIYFTSYPGLPGTILNPIRFFLKQVTWYKKIKSEFGSPVLTHVHVMARNSLLANYLKIFKRIPFIISEHWSGYFPSSKKLRGLRKNIYRILFKRADTVTAVSHSLGLAIQKACEISDFKVVPNIVDDVFLKAPLSIGSDPLKRIVHISNLISEVKQSDRILHIINELAGERTDFELYIIGDGPERNSLEEQSKSLQNLIQRLKFTGDIPQNELADILKSTDLCVSFSKFETQSIVLLESISMGIPVVAPDVGGIPEHCSDKGVLFPVDDEKAFKTGIIDVLDGNKKWNQQEFRDYCTSRFTSSKISATFLEIYRSISTDIHV